MKTRNDYPFFADVPAEQYHEDARQGRFLSSHKLGTFRKCPRAYQMEMSGEIERADSAAFQMGRAVHSLVCEGRAAFDAEFIVTDGPINAKTGEPFGKLTRAYREWAATQKLTPISTTDFGFLTKLQRAVWCHPVAGELLTNGWAEGTVRTTYCDEPVQIRIDYFNPNYVNPVTGECGAIVDLKTCDTIDFFESDARKYGYVHQLSFYRETLRIACGEEFPVYIVAVEKKEPHRVGVWRLSTDALDQAKCANEKAINLLKECRRVNEWPTGYEEMRIMDSL